MSLEIDNMYNCNKCNNLTFININKNINVTTLENTNYLIQILCEDCSNTFNNVQWNNNIDKEFIQKYFNASSSDSSDESDDDDIPPKYPHPITKSYYKAYPLEYWESSDYYEWNLDSLEIKPHSILVNIIVH